MKRSEKAILLALEVMLNSKLSLKERKARREEALDEINRALEESGVRMPENTSGW